MDGLKQRVIGALVLISLVVIFVPMLFDEPHSERTSSTIKLPEEPPFPEVEAPRTPTSETPAYRIEEPDLPVQAAEPAEPVQAPSTVAESTREPEPVQAPESNSKIQPQTQSQAEPEPKPEPADSVEYARSLEGAWVVQLGSFGSADNARRLRENVREKGYSSHLQEITRGDQTLTRVFSGPFAEKAEAERAKQVLDKAFGLNALVTTGDK